MRDDTKGMVKERVAGTPRLWVRHPAGARHCPGCHHPQVERLVCEVLEEMGLEGRAIGIAGVGCSTRFFTVVRVDGITTAHGHPPDVATGIKRVRPDALVFTIQGDGDCIAIGAGALINAAARAEKITIVMVNNAGYGTTGGQMGPTTLMGQITSTTPLGRDPSSGYPVHVAELIAPMKGVVYSARGSLHTPAHYQRTKRYLKAAFQKQVEGVGLSFLEVLAACPPDWHLTPVECLQWIEEEMVKEFPLGEFKSVDRLD